MNTKTLIFRITVALALIFAALPHPTNHTVAAEPLQPAPMAAGENLLANGDFESGAASWEGIDASQLVTGSASSGNTSVKITSEKEASQGWISVTPGKTYELTAAFKWVEFTGSNWGLDRIRVVDYDWSELAVSNNLHAQYGKGNWNTVRLSFTPRTDKVRVQFGLFGPQDRVELYFDNFILRDPAAAPVDSAELISNGDFENGAVPWQGINDSQLVTGGAQNGNRALKITAETNAAQGWLNVTPGTRYELRAWFKWNEFSGSNWGYPRIKVSNFDWSEAVAINHLHTLYPKGQWSEIKLVFTPKSDKVVIEMGQFGPQDRSELYFDNFSLKAVDPSAPTATATPVVTATAVATATVAAPTHTAVAPTAAPSTVPPTVAPTSAPINGVNLLQNADFENGSTPWQFLASGRTATAATIVSSGAQNGNNAVKIASDLDVRQGWITVTPGKTYELTGWYKWVQYSGSNWGYDRVRVDENTWAELASINVLHSKFPQNTWSQFKLTFTPKTKAVNISIGQFGPQDRVEFYFDNLVLVEQGAAVPTTVPTTAPTVTKTVVAPTNTVVAPTAVQPTVTKTAVQPTAVAPTATPINPVGGNMVQNGSFESGAVAPWSDITNTNLVSNVAHTGTRSVRINSNLEAKQGWIPVTPGKTYELTMWYRWDEFSGSNWGYDRVRVANYDWSEAAVKNQLHTLYPRNTWNLVSLTFTPTKNFVNVSFGQFGPQDRIDMYFDDVILVEKGAGGQQPTATQPAATATTVPATATTVPATPTTVVTATSVATATAVVPTATTVPGGPPPPAAPVAEMLTNGDFENGAAPWDFQVNGASVSPSLATGGAQSGSTSAKITGAMDVRQGWFNVTPGKTYTLSGWYKWSAWSGSNWGYDRLRVVNSSWQDVATLNNMHAQYPQNTWNKVTLSFTPTVDRVLVTFGQFGPQDRTEFYFDSLSLSEGGGLGGGEGAPVVSMRADVTSGPAPLTVNFTTTASDADGSIARYAWDFGDGTSDTAQNPKHVYQSNGNFVARVTVFDNEGKFTAAQSTIVVSGNGGSGGPLQIQQPTSNTTWSTTNSTVTLSGVAQGAKWVSWDNVDTGEAGVVTGSSLNSWQTGTLNLKPGRNEILISSADGSNKISTDRLIITRTVSGPVISNVKVASNSVPRYDKYELTFDLATVAENYFYSYDTNPPAGVRAGIGVTAEAVFTSPSGKTLVQPAFWTTEAYRDGGSGIGHYTQGTRSFWSVRFAPQETGSYQVTLRVTDASGSTSTNVGSFTSTSSSDPGFISVSKADTRYFEYSNGQIYWPIGPANGPDYTRFKDTGMNIHRQWMAGLGAYSTNFARWMSTAQQMGNEGFDSRLSWREHYPSHELSQELFWSTGKRMWIGWLQGEPYAPRLKANTTYQVLARIKTMELSGPADSRYPSGFMIKAGGWPNDGVEAAMRGNPSFIPPVSQNSDWFTVVARYNTASYPTGPYLYFFLDNVTSGKVYIDQVSIREVLPDGSLGGEQVVNTSADMHSYVEPRAAAAIDYQVNEAEANGVKLKYVVQDKRDWVHEHLATSGAWVDGGAGYYQPEGTKSFWIQKQWWRYLLARWSYSTAIETWELNNEGSPDDRNHWAATERFGKYLHENSVHPHMVTTSFWSGWKPEFWGSGQYPNVDYADVHTYIHDKNLAYDTVAWQLNTSASYYSGNVRKPIMMGEYGISAPGNEMFNYLTRDNDGDWFHDILWSQLAPGALYNPNYWWMEHFAKINEEQIARPFWLFVRDLDLNKGGYSNIGAAVENGNLNVIGQKNIGAGKAHAWIQNKMHTWRNTMGIDGPSGVGSINCGFTFQMAPNTDYVVQWYDTKTGNVTSTQNVRSDGSGNIRLTVSNLSADTAIKVTKK